MQNNKGIDWFSTLPAWWESLDSSVGIALGYGLDDRGSRVRFPAGAGNFSLHHRAHPASYPMGTRGSFPGGKAAGAWSWPLTCIQYRAQRMSGTIPPFPQYAFMAWCSVKAQGQLYLTFYQPGGLFYAAAPRPASREIRLDWSATQMRRRCCW
jgi:hypothetical protein